MQLNNMQAILHNIYKYEIFWYGNQPLTQMYPFIEHTLELGQTLICKRGVI